MSEKKLDEIRKVLSSIKLKNRSTNIIDSNIVSGLELKENVITFALDRAPEQHNHTAENKKTI
jgi:hypothetical protein